MRKDDGSAIHVADLWPSIARIVRTTTEDSVIEGIPE
jgi:hypothetical protein